MAILSDNIEAFIKSLLGEYETMVELQRNELAQYFGCAPSQINYVLATRFSPERGYLVESRRGGGGYIKLVRIDVNRQEALLSAISGRLASAISERDARNLIDSLMDAGCLSEREARMARAASSEKALNVPLPVKDRLRASILKEMFTTLLAEEG